MNYVVDEQCVCLGSCKKKKERKEKTTKKNKQHIISIRASMNGTPDITYKPLLH